MRKLIVNADDFGFNREVTDGIIQCHQKGCVTSTTLMANMPAAEYAAEQAKKFPNLSVGIHFALSDGPVVSAPGKIPALVNKDGQFPDSAVVVSLAKQCRLPLGQIELEFTAQIEKFLSLGITPTHCNSHQNIEVYPQPCIAIMRVAKKYNIKRMRTHRGWHLMDKTEGFKMNNLFKMLRANMARGHKIIYYDLFHYYRKLRGYKLPNTKFGFSRIISSSPLKCDLASWAILLQNLPEGASELIAHPGLPSDDPLDHAWFRKKRVLEYELFSNPKTKQLCREFGVDLVNYKAV